MNKGVLSGLWVGVSECKSYLIVNINDCLSLFEGVNDELDILVCEIYNLLYILFVISFI